MRADAAVSDDRECHARSQIFFKLTCMDSLHLGDEFSKRRRHAPAQDQLGAAAAGPRGSSSRPSNRAKLVPSCSRLPAGWGLRVWSPSIASASTGQAAATTGSRSRTGNILLSAASRTSSKAELRSLTNCPPGPMSALGASGRAAPKEEVRVWTHSRPSKQS
jgi:hypothetical protein